MKIIYTILLLLLNMNLLGQINSFEDVPKVILEHLDKMGVDSSLSLNNYESNYLNIIFEYSRKDFDFAKKKIGFVTGSNGNTSSSKKCYFELEKDRYRRNNSPNKGTLYIFDKNQKAESGGYDAIVVYWCKVLLQSKDLVKKMSSLNNNP